MNLGQRRLRMVVEVHETMTLNPLRAHLGDNPANDPKRRLMVMRFPCDVSRSLIQRTVEAPSSGVRPQVKGETHALVGQLERRQHDPKIGSLNGTGGIMRRRRRTPRNRARA